MRDPAHLNPTVVFAPTADEFLDGYATTRSRLVIVTLKHVLGQAYVYHAGGQDGLTRKHWTFLKTAPSNRDRQRHQRGFLPQIGKLPHPASLLWRRGHGN